MKHFTIVIKVAYDEDTIHPESLEWDLADNVERAIGQGLLADHSGEAIIEEHSVEIKEVK